MSKVWTEKLPQSQVAFMNDIIAQIPETMGARQAFINGLQALADAPADAVKIPFQYIIVTQGDVLGTNDFGVARSYAETEEDYVVDALTGKWFCTNDPSDDTDLTEAK